MSTFHEVAVGPIPVLRFRPGRPQGRQKLARTTPLHEPAEATIGSAWSWDVTYADFPADESWQLNYYLRGAFDLDLAWGTHVTAAASGPAFEVRVTAAQSGAVTTAGRYWMTGRVSKSGDEFDGTVIYHAPILLLADPSDAVNAKSTDRQMLEAIETALLAGISTTAEKKRITINGRTIEYRDRVELETARARYRMLVAIEENPGGRLLHEVEFRG